MASLDRRHVVIAGGTGDIGTATATELVRRGASVTVIGRREQDSGVVRPGVAYRRADVRDRPVLERVLDEVDPFDVLISNAAIVRSAPFLAIEAQDWQAQLDTNLTGGFNVGQLGARLMVARGQRGRIIFVGSWVGEEAWPEIAGYSAAKAGLRMLVRSMALELAPHGILVNLVAPGIVRAGMAKRQLETEPHYARRVAVAVPLGELQTAEQVARVIAFLCSDDADYMTGSIVLADGGASLLHGGPIVGSGG